MAEYAGLEIRIGGNTTKLNNALKASTKSAAELQRNIRQITQAMQFDPKSLRNVETRIRITGDRMQSLQSKSQLVAESMKQLGDTMVSFRGSEKSIRDIANDTDNLTLATKQADQQYAEMTGSLAKIYDAWNKLARSKGVDFANDFLNIDKETGRRLMSASTSVTTLREEIAELNRERKGTKKPIISDEDIEKLLKFKNINFHNMFENGLDLDQVIQQAEELGITISDSAIANVRELQVAFRDAAAEKSIFDDALQFEQGQVDLQRFNSEAESLSETMRWLDDSISETSKLPMFQGAEDDIRRVDAALDNVEKDLERTSEAMKADPKNVQLAARYMQDLQQKASLTEEKTSLLNKQMQLLKSSGAKEAARDHQDLAKWVEESAESARVAKKELSEQQATVKNLEQAAGRASQSLRTMKRDSNMAEFSDNVLRWESDTQKLEKEMKKLESATKSAADAQRNFDEANARFVEADDRVTKLSNSVRRLERQYKKLYDAAEQGITDGTFGPDEMRHLAEVEQQYKQTKEALSQARAERMNFKKAMQDPLQINEGVQSNLKDVTSRVDRLKESINKLEKTKEVKLFKNPESLEEEEKSLEELQVELKKARDEEKRRQAAYDSAAAENNLAKEAKQFQEVEQQIEETKVKYIAATEAMSKESGRILNPSTIKSLGMTLSATLTPVIAGIGMSMLDASTDIDTAYRNMRKTVDGTDDQFEELRKHAMEFASTHVTSADQILEIEALGGELGVATEDLEAFAEAISNIDVSTDLDTEEAADVLGHLSNILHLSAEDYNGFADALVRLGNNGASTESEIANIAERIGSMGSIVGMSASDVLAWASSIASTGQNAEAAGTAISKTMSFFETAVASAGGTIDTSFEAINAAVQGGGDELTVFANLVGKTSEEFTEAWASDPKEAFKEVEESVKGAKESLEGIADVAHMTADEFAQTWESDPTKAMEAFIKGLNDIEAAGGSADKVLQGFKITSVRQKQAIEGLMQTIGGLDNNLQMSEDAWNGLSDKWGQAGDAANEASKKAEGFSGQISILKNVWHNALAELGEGAAPWLQRFTGMVSTLSNEFSDMSIGAKEALVAVGGVTFATGPLLTFISTMITAKDNIKSWARESFTALTIVQDTYKELGNDGVKALTGMNYGMATAKIAAKELGTALLKGLAAGAVVAGIAAISYVLKALYDQHQDYIASTEGLTSAISGIGVASDEAVAGVGGTKRALDELIMDAGASESRLADLAKTLQDSNSQYGTFAGQMEYYADTIKELGSKTERSKDESYKLEAALKAVNDACGTNYSVSEFGDIIDTETGKVQDNTDVILANIEARKQQALIDYYSDDYAKAIAEQEDARQTVYGLAAEYRKLQTEAGKTEWIDNYVEKTGRADLAESAFKDHLTQTKNALSEGKAEFDRTSEVVATLDEKIGNASERMNEANQTIEEAARAEEEYGKRSETVTSDVTGNMKKLSDAFTELGGDDAGFNAMVDGLESIHVSADELNGVDMSALASAFSDANGSMQDIVKTLEDGGVKMETWNSALEQAPGAAENMSSLTSAAFSAMYEMAGQDINGTMTLIAGLDAVQVEDKTFYIGDNGSITDSEGKVYDLQKDIDKLPSQVVTKVKGDNTDAQKKVSQTNSELNKTDKKTANPKINARDFATTTIDSIKRKITDLDGKSATTYVYTVHKDKDGHQATGGMNNVPVIPRHATGYIATGPTLTNQGWIGEDGIEVVANWATGGAVVPLTNKRYMLPIADAIADGMSRRLGDVTNSAPQISIVVNGVSSPDDVADAITRRLSILNF